MLMLAIDQEQLALGQLFALKIVSAQVHVRSIRCRSALLDALIHIYV